MMKNEIKKFKENLEYKRIEVIWFDAQSSTCSFTIEEVRENLRPALSRSLGYLLYETKTYIVLGFTTFDSTLIKHHQCIPKGMILSTEEVK